MLFKKGPFTLFILANSLLIYIYQSSIYKTNKDHEKVWLAKEPCLLTGINLTLVAFIKPVDLQVRRLEQMLLPSLALFWPTENLKLTIVTENSDEMVGKIQQISNRILPKGVKISIQLTTLDGNSTGLNRTENERKKQIVKFWADNFTNSEFIGIVDADTVFVTPILTSDLFQDGKPIVRGTYGKPKDIFIKSWAASTKLATGTDYFANFMSYFPVILRRDDFENIRNHVNQHLNVSKFDQAFDIFTTTGQIYSEFCIMANYLWHYQQNNYHWILTKVANSSRYFSTGDADFEQHFPQVDKFLSRRQPAVSTHWAWSQRHLLGGSIERLFLNGICFADENMRNLCDSSLDANYYFYNNFNKAEWLFDLGDDFSQTDTSIALLNHQQRLNRLSKCEFAWNHTFIERLKMKLGGK